MQVKEDFRCIKNQLDVPNEKRNQDRCWFTILWPEFPNIVKKLSAIFQNLMHIHKKLLLTQILFLTILTFIVVLLNHILHSYPHHTGNFY